MIKKPCLFIGLAMGLGLLLALPWLLIGRASQVALAQSGSGIIRVATTGSDTSGCGSQASPCRSLQYAVDLAQAGDEIRVAAGSYTGVQGHAVPAGYPNPPASGVITQVVYLYKTVTIRGGYTIAFSDPPDPQANPTTLDAQGLGRAMVVAGSVSPTVTGLRFTGGEADGLGGGTMGPSGGGGGVYIIGATSLFINNRVYDNNTGDGGGLFLQDSPATLIGNDIYSNTVKYYGGGVFLNNSAATLNGNTIHANTATSYLGSGGGAYVRESSASLNGNTVYSNTAESNGGGILFNTSPNSTIIANTFMSNTATSGRGGGLWIRYGDGTVLSGNTVLANHAADDRGGGLYVDQSHATLVGNTVESNIADSGGGLYLSGREVTMTANLVLSNTALMGGGVYLEYNDSTLNANTISHNQATFDNGEGGGVFLYFSDAVLDRNIITFNHADWGGGLGVFSSSPLLTNTVVSDNTADKHGSGLSIRHTSSPRIWHTTITRNRGGDETGVYITHLGCSVTMTNTILVDQTVGISVTLDDAVTMAGTLWYSNTLDWSGPGAIITGTHNYKGDPLFAADGYHLMAGSAAIDHGINARVAHDIDNEARLGIPDLGADELGKPHIFLPLVLRNN